MVDVSLQQLGLEFGSGGVIGGTIGFAVRKVAKVIAVLVGAELALFKSLGSRVVITVDWERLTASVVEASRDAATGGPPFWPQTLLSTLSVSAGFTGGIPVGHRTPMACLDSLKP